MKCVNCGTESRPFYVRASGVRCTRCDEQSRSGAPAIQPRPSARAPRFWWRQDSETAMSCYVITDGSLHRKVEYAGCVRYDRGNWLTRLLRPNRWHARAGFNIGRFRYQYEAQLYVEHHAGGGE
jgi:hypothetical protein